MSTKFWLFAASAAAALVTGNQAQAQTPAEEPAARDNEIVITATRRDQSLQDVPVAVTPVTAELIQNSGIRDLQDVASVAPSLQFNVSENETSATARMRGVGTQGSNPGLESAVGIFIDGVYRARNGVGLSDLGEVSQIEVLRGPQGTLFGRNTSAGLITVNTAKPSFSDVMAKAAVTYGNYENLRVEGSVNVPLGETFAVRVFAATDVRDGFLDLNKFGSNAALGATNATSNLGRDESNNRDMWTVRGQALWEITPDLEVRFIADYTERDETCCASKIYRPSLLNGNTLLSNNNTFTATGIPQDPFQPNITGVSTAGQANAIAALGGYGTGGLANLGSGEIGARFAFANREYSQQLEDTGYSLEVNWDLGGVTLTSITAYRDWLYDQGQDADFSQADLWYRTNNGLNGFGFEVFTQEVRAAFDLGDVDSIVGVFFADETLTRRDALQNGAQFGTYFAALSTLFTGLATTANNTGIRDRYVQEGQSIAAFTHNIWAVDDKTDITVGLRLTREEKDVEATFNTSFNAQPVLVATLNGVSPGLGTAFGNCSGSLSGTAADAAIIGARGGYCLPTLRAGLDGGVRRQSRSEEEWSGVVSARREFTDDISGYASYSRGYKGGGFNLDRNFDFQLATAAPGSQWNTNFEAEFVDAWELGMKSSFLEGDLTVNTALFFNKYENYQLNTFNGVSFQVSSVPEVTSQGVEVDSFWNTDVDGLTFQGGFAYIEAEYGTDSGWVAQSANPLNPTARPVNFRLPGSRLTNAPLWTATGAFTYEKSLFNDAMLGVAYLDFRYVSSQVTGSDLEPTKTQPEYVTFNGRLALRTDDERFGIELWGRNLTDKEVQQITFNVPLQGNARGAFLGDPRTYGVTLRYNY